MKKLTLNKETISLLHGSEIDNPKGAVQNANLILSELEPEICLVASMLAMCPNTGRPLVCITF